MQRIITSLLTISLTSLDYLTTPIIVVIGLKKMPKVGGTLGLGILTSGRS